MSIASAVINFLCADTAITDLVAADRIINGRINDDDSPVSFAPYVSVTSPNSERIGASQKGIFVREEIWIECRAGGAAACRAIQTAILLKLRSKKPLLADDEGTFVYLQWFDGSREPQAAGVFYSRDRFYNTSTVVRS